MRFSTAELVATAILVFAAPALADNAIPLTLKDHKFTPAEIHVKANVPNVITMTNRDSTAEEFDSTSLKVEKVVTGNGEGIIRLRPLEPGRYNFFDDFHQETTGVLVVR